MLSRFYVPFTPDDLSGGVKNFITETLPEEGAENIYPEYQGEKEAVVPPKVKRKGCKMDLELQFASLQDPPQDPLQMLIQDEEAGFNIWGH